MNIETFKFNLFKSNLDMRMVKELMKCVRNNKIE